MTGKTHAAAGAFLGALAGKALGCPLAGAAAGALAALLPDVDHPGSAVGRRLRPLSLALEAAAGHRTVTHTVWFCLAAALGLGLLSALAGGCLPPALSLPLPTPWEMGVCALLGGLSHLALDACTRSGVEPFAPLVLPGRLARLNRIAGPLATGDPFTEWPAAVLLGVGAAKLTGLI